MRRIGGAGEGAPAAFGAAVAAAERHAVITGQRPHPPRTAVEQRLATTVREAGDEPADAAKAFAEATGGGDGFEQHAAGAELEGDIDEIVVVGQPHGISARDAGGSAETSEQIAKVMERLGMDELAQRFVDQRDMGVAQQAVDVLGCAQDDPVERQLEEIGTVLNARAVVRALLRRSCHGRFRRRFPSAPVPIRSLE